MRAQRASAPRTKSAFLTRFTGPRQPVVTYVIIAICALVFIAQLLTLGVARTLAEAGEVPPMYISANIPGGDEHNFALEARYLDRLRRGA